jgi:hypothetical protein
MLKTFGMVAAAALLASVTAFAQNEPSSSPSSSDQAPATAPADNSASTDTSAETEKPMKHHRRHSHMGTGSRATDDNADKLNACMSNATPTAQQEQCLKAAAGTGNG